MLSVVFLTYFLLANGPLFRRELAGPLPGRDELHRREHLLGEIGVAASHYLVTVTAVNAGVGALTALALWLVGVPSPLLWGGMAAIFNFVPYLGPVVTAVIITFASLVSIDATAHALLAPLGVRADPFDREQRRHADVTGTASAAEHGCHLCGFTLLRLVVGHSRRRAGGAAHGLREARM